MNNLGRVVGRLGGGSEVQSFMRTLIIVGVVVVLLRGAVVEPYRIPSRSMVPTLQVKDFILVSKMSFGFRLPFVTETLLQYSAPERGDIVVFTRLDDPSTEKDEAADNIIKRVIGLPGETLEVRGVHVFINGEPLDEPYARWGLGGFRTPDFGPVTIPEGTVMLLGDNRDNSQDSRFWFNPFLPISRIKGRALIVYWSGKEFDRVGTIIR